MLRIRQGMDRWSQEGINNPLITMKYRAFKRLIVERIPEPTELRTEGGLYYSPSAENKSYVARGRVLDGRLWKMEASARMASDDLGDRIASVGEGMEIIFSLSAPTDGRVYFVDESNVYGIVDNDD